MKKPTFTKGPWTREENRDRTTSFYPAERYPCMQPIASCWASDISEHAKEENKANARLIAAAPELFEQCKLFGKAFMLISEVAEAGGPDSKRAIGLFEDLGFGEKELNQLRELLAKVEGEK